MVADEVNCYIGRNGLIEPIVGELYCIVRAYDSSGDTGVWAFMVLPVPLLDSQTVLDLDVPEAMVVRRAQNIAAGQLAPVQADQWVFAAQ
jgi:hypothetical protein